jgi:flagellar biosynthesis protein FlhA
MGSDHAGASPARHGQSVSTPPALSGPTIEAQPQPEAAGRGSASRDVLFAVGIAAMLAILFLPLPVVLIDFGLAVSFAVSVLILMVALWIRKPLEFSAFPLILLIATMLRLSLNIATTRGILANGHEGPEAAGHVIAGFAQFVMGGDFVIGLIVFSILVIVNFIVITKGATRIAEVSARFTLDGIPGKQMAIDADLNAGLITNAEAQTRRRELEEETAFFGAMDGASKFVRGDAVAGLIITLINIFGGIVLGVARHELSFAEAADTYTKLSVGDGLVSQIPALIISLAAGILVSKGQTAGSAQETVFKQLSGSPMALNVSAGLLATMALMPGLPFIPFMLLAGSMAALGVTMPKRKAEELAAEEAGRRAAAAVEQKSARESIKTSLDVAKIELALGRQLSARLLNDHGELAGRVAKMRKRFARQYGFIVPEIVLGDDLDLAAKDYAVRIHGTMVASGTLPVGELIVILGDRDAPALPHEPFKEPAFGMKAATFPAAYGAQLRQAGFEPVEDIAILLTHLSETLARNLAQLLSYGDVKALIDRLPTEYHRLVDEITPQHLSLSGLQAVLKLLLAEQVSVRNLALILEAVAEIAPHLKRPEAIVEHVRMRIAQQICGDIADNDALRVLRLGSRWEQAFQQALRRDARGEPTGFDFEPGEIEAFGKEAAERIRALMEEGRRFALVTAPDVRVYVRMIIERVFPALPVLSHGEIARGAKVELLGAIS